MMNCTISDLSNTWNLKFIHSEKATKFRCSLGHQSINALVFLKAYVFFKKKEQEEKDMIEKERLERIELLHQQLVPKILIKHSAKNNYICTYYKTICPMYCQSNNWWRFRKICGLLRIYELYIIEG